MRGAISPAKMPPWIESMLTILIISSEHWKSSVKLFSTHNAKLDVNGYSTTASPSGVIVSDPFSYAKS